MQKGFIEKQSEEPPDPFSKSGKSIDRPKPDAGSFKFSQIFIANLAEIALPLARYMTKRQYEQEIREDHAYCDRFAYSTRDNRILITPLALDPEFFHDLNQLLNFKHVYNWYPEKIEASICQAILEDGALLEKLIELIRANPGIQLVSYAATPEFKRLVAFLKEKGLQFSLPEMPEAENLWAAAFFDSKAGFRQAGYCLGPGFATLPRGAICRSQNAVIGWARRLFHQKGGVVLKINRGLAGAGVAIITSETLGERTLEEFIRQLFKSEPFWEKGTVVVEEYIKPNIGIGGGALSVEMKLEGRNIRPLYTCGMRIGKGKEFRGVEIGKEALDDKVEQKLFKLGRTLGEFLREFGYQGFFDIDVMPDKKGRLFPIEANLRRTGGTHAYELGKRLLGSGFTKKYYLISQVKTRAAKARGWSYPKLKEKLEPWLFPIQGREEGIILTVLNYLPKGYLGFTVVGANKKRANQIEAAFLNIVN